jgi:hypothetical protein
MRNLLDGLHDSLEPNGVEVQIKISDHPIIERLSVGRFWSPNDGISAGVIVRQIPIRGHHEDDATLPNGVPVGTYPDLGIIIWWILIGDAANDDELDALANGQRVDVTTEIPRMNLAVRM